MDKPGSVGSFAITQVYLGLTLLYLTWKGDLLFSEEFETVCVYSRNSKVADFAFSIPMYFPYSVISGYYVKVRKIYWLNGLIF